MDKAQRRQELLRAARHVFATQGYHDAKVDDIVAAAAVAKGTFYLYFRDKRSIFVELVDALFERLGAAILRVDVKGDVAEQIRHNIRAVLKVLLDEPETTQILMSHATGLDRQFTTKIESFYSAILELFTTALEDGQQLGIISPGNPRLLATFTIGGVKETLQTLARSKEPLPLEEIVRGLYELLEHGYLRIPTHPPSVPPAMVLTEKKPKARPDAAKKRKPAARTGR